MGLTREQKQAVVTEVNSVAVEALSAVVSDYKGLTAEEVTALRIEARQNQVWLRVVRNTLAKRALEGTRFACLSEALSGPTLLAFSKHEPGAPARLFKTFIKDHEKLNVRALSLGGHLLSADRLNEVSSLPTYLESVASLAMMLKLPLTQFVRTCAEPYAQLVRLLSAVSEKKKAGHA